MHFALSVIRIFSTEKALRGIRGRITEWRRTPAQGTTKAEGAA